MKELASARSWEYAYKKELERQLEVFRTQLEAAGLDDFQYLRGTINGIRICIKEMSEAREKHNLDDDADMRE